MYDAYSVHLTIHESSHTHRRELEKSEHTAKTSDWVGEVVLTPQDQQTPPEISLPLRQEDGVHALDKLTA